MAIQYADLVAHIRESGYYGEGEQAHPRWRNSATCARARLMSRADREELVREQLERSRESIFGGGNPALLAALRSAVPGLTRAYVIDWIPEQGEEIYTVLVSEDAIVTLEIDRVSGAASDVKVHNIHQYRRDHRKLSRVRREKLEQALVLLRSSQ